VPRFFDLIEPKHPCYNTLVNRIAFDGGRRWKVATVARQLIDTARTMSGGGNQPPRGAMTSKFATETVRPEVQLVCVQESQDVAAQKLEKALQALRQARGRVERLKNPGAKTKVEFQKRGLDIENSKKSIADTDKTLQEVWYVPLLLLC